MVEPDASFAAAVPAVGASRWWVRAVGTLVLLAIATAALQYGLRLRRYAWDATDEIRFRGDIAAGWNWGGRANDRGLFTFYDDLEADVRAGRGRRNDYPPLRLSIMTAWNGWTRTHFPDARAWRNEFDFTSPMLNANTAAELSSSVLVFAIIVLLRIRSESSHASLWPVRGWRRRHRALRAAGTGLFGGLLFWFNPAVIWDSHCWPQWDVWLMPLFLAAALAACAGGWFVAGVCVAIGACLKGQMLLGAPVLLLWPLFRGHVGAAIGLVSGLLVGIATIALPWMHPPPPAWNWLGFAAASVAVVRLLDSASRFELRRRSPAAERTHATGVPFAPSRRSMALLRSAPPLGWGWTLLVTTVALALAWPWRSAASFETLLLAWLPPVIAALAGAFSWRTRWAMTALAIAAAVLLTMPLFDAGTGWLTMGFLYGAEKFENMFTGSGSWNVPAMLIRYLQWTRDPGQLVAVPGLAERITAKTLMSGVYVVALVLSGIAAARQARRRDSRLVVALVVPWLAAFMLLPQMHGRYSVWTAGFCALLAGESIGLALLGIIVGVVAALGIVENQMMFERDYAPETVELLRRLDPHLGWVLLLAMLILLYVAQSPRRPTRLL